MYKVSRFIFTGLFLLGCHAAVHAQDSQQFRDDAYKAFREVVANRDTIAKQKDTIEAQDSLIKAQTAEIKKLLEGQESRDREIEKWKALKCEETETKILFWVHRTKKCQ